MDAQDLIRGFEEFDEKLPSVAKIIVQRGIDFSRLNDGIEADTSVEFEANLEVFNSISAIFREMVECTSEMTADEFEYYIGILLTACELVVMVNDGLVHKNDDGSFILTSKGKSLVKEMETCAENDGLIYKNKDGSFMPSPEGESLFEES